MISKHSKLPLGSGRRFLNSLVATEEFSIGFSVSPKPPAAPVFTQSTLSNGIKLSTKDNSSKVVSFKISASAGSAYEGTKSKGVAQLLASSAFVSTKKASSISLVRKLENLGAVFNSTADREKITLSLTAPSENAEEAFKSFSQFFVHGPSAPYLIEESKEIAQIAYDEHLSSPASILSELIHEAAYGEGSAHGSSFFASSLDKVCAADALTFRSAQFKTGGTSLAVNGLEHKVAQAWAEMTLQDLASGNIKAPDATFVGGDVKLKADTDGIAHVALAFPLPAGTAAKPYEVLSSVLAQKFVQSHISPFVIKYTHGGLFGFYVSGQSKDTPALLEQVVAELKSIAGGKAGSVDAAKHQLSLHRALSLDGDGASSVLLNALHSGLSVADASKYGDVNSNTVTGAAGSALRGNAAYAVLGSTIGTLSYENVTKLLK